MIIYLLSNWISKQENEYKLHLMLTIKRIFFSPISRFLLDGFKGKRNDKLSNTDSCDLDFRW